MSDFTMCATEGCPSEALCWRKKAPKHSMQSFALFEIPEGKSRCENFWPFASAEWVDETHRLDALNRHRDDVITTADQAVS